MATKETKPARNPLWGGRFDSGPDEIMSAINASVDFDSRLAAVDIRASLAHVKMLAECNIISQSDAKKIIAGLEQIQQEVSTDRFRFSAALEDVHMNIEGRLAEVIGPVAGRLHTARSRNDQVATDLRLWLRDQIDDIDHALRDLQRAFLGQARNGTEMVMPGFTHLQVAQPISWGFHMLAYVEMLARDRGRLRDARHRLNECPLGAAALAGTTFDISRWQVAQELDFDRIAENALDAVSDRDYVLEFMSAAAILVVHLSRFAEELVVWSSSAFNFVRLPDSLSTGSSIMPQKRNPDAAELVRAKAGRVFGALIALLTVMKGLPLAYAKDMQEDKEPLFDVVDTLALVIPATTAMVRELEPNEGAMRAAAATSGATATDLADWLVQACNMPFREAHGVVGKIVKLAEDAGVELAELTLQQLQSVEPRISDDGRAVLDVTYAMDGRRSLGGTAPNRVAERIQFWEGELGR